MSDAPKPDLRGYERALPITLLRAREATMRLFKPYVDQAGLTLPQWRVIRALAEGGAHDAAELAEKCAVLPPSLSRIIAHLQDRGLIQREKGERDARRLSLTLTDEGRTLFDAIAPMSEVVYLELETRFGAERMARLLADLDDLREVASEMQASADRDPPR